MAHALDSDPPRRIVDDAAVGRRRLRLYVYILLILARLVRRLDAAVRPRLAAGRVAAIGVELVYIATDPPIRLLRRLVPPLRSVL